jgi:hypothetical protein
MHDIAMGFLCSAYPHDFFGGRTKRSSMIGRHTRGRATLAMGCGTDRADGQGKNQT